MENRIAGVVVTYNPTKNELENIKSYINDLDKLYVVDNSNIDNKILLDSVIIDSKIEYCPLLDNLGIATALNIGCKKAFDEGYEWILTMDQDSTFKDGDLNNLIKILDKDYKWELTSNYDSDNKQVELTNLKDDVAIVTPLHRTKFGNDGFDGETLYIDETMTSGNLVNLTILSKLGWFLDWMFIDAVDAEYCARLKREGYKILQVTSIELEHNLGNQTEHRLLWKKYVCSNHNYIRRYYITRNNLYFYQMYGEDNPEFEIRTHLKLLIVLIILYEKDKFKKLKSIFYGRRDFKKGIKGKREFN